MKVDQFMETSLTIKSTEIQEWRQEVCGIQSVCISPHWHEQMEILYIVQGEMDLKIGEDSFRGVPGTAVIINPRQIHSGICASDKLVYDVVQLSIEALLSNSSVSEQYIELLLNEKVRFFTKPTNPEAVDALLQWIRCLRSKPHPLEAVGQTYLTLSKLFQLCAVEQGIF